MTVISVYLNIDAVIIRCIYIWLVTSVCLYIYMLLVYERVLENVFGVLESPGKVLEIFLNKRVGTLAICLCVLMSL